LEIIKTIKNNKVAEMSKAGKNVENCENTISIVKSQTFHGWLAKSTRLLWDMLVWVR
jgi:hypothetical protein